MRIRDWSSDVCSSDLMPISPLPPPRSGPQGSGGRSAAAAAAKSASSITGASGPLTTFAQSATSPKRARFGFKLGRASCRERVCQYVEISVVPVYLKIKNQQYDIILHLYHDSKQ